LPAQYDSEALAMVNYRDILSADRFCCVLMVIGFYVGCLLIICWT
jgi:hypothetical protein